MGVETELDALSYQLSEQTWNNEKAFQFFDPKAEAKIWLLLSNVCST